MSLKENRYILFVALLFSFILFTNSYYITCSNDGSHFALVSSLVEHRSLTINQFVHYTQYIDFNYKDKNFYSDRPIGTAILAIPFYAFGHLLDWMTLSKYITSHPNIKEVFVVFLSNIAGILAFILLLKLCRLFAFSFKVSLTASTIFLFSTLLFFESTHLYSHAVSLTTMLYATYLIIRIQQVDKRIILLSAVLALSSITEAQNILFIIPILIYLVTSKKLQIGRLSGLQKKYLVISLLAFLSIYSLLFIYNYSMFGQITIKSNIYNPLFPEEKRLLTSLSGNLFLGLDKLYLNLFSNKLIFNWKLAVRNNTPGMFITTPVLFCSLAGFYIFIKRHKNEAVLFIGFILIASIIAAKHKTVLTRHITTVIPYLFFPLVFVLDTSYRGNRVIQVLTALSIYLLSLLSLMRVFYVMNCHEKRSLSYPFAFLNELPSFVIFYGSVSVLFVIYKYVVKRYISDSTLRK